jgi:hypothetical protein
MPVRYYILISRFKSTTPEKLYKISKNLNFRNEASTFTMGSSLFGCGTFLQSQKNACECVTDELCKHEIY